MSHKYLDEGDAQLVNDPGYWGATLPKVLVLGMSKGFTQSNAMALSASDGSFDRVAFASFRPRLLQSLQAIGLLKQERDIDSRFKASEKHYGWASIVRCSLTARSKVNGVERYVATSKAVVRAMKGREVNEHLANCIKRYVAPLSSKTKLVVLLSNDDDYLSLMAKTMARLFDDYAPHPTFGPVVFKAGGRFFVHTAHPSPLNGHFSSFLSDPPNGGQGKKRHFASIGVRGAVGDQLGLI